MPIERLRCNAITRPRLYLTAGSVVSIIVDKELDPREWMGKTARVGDPEYGEIVGVIVKILNREVWLQVVDSMVNRNAPWLKVCDDWVSDKTEQWLERWARR